LRSLNGIKRLSFKIQADGIEQEVGVPGRGVMHEIENLQDSAEHCFELASAQNFLEEDVASQAFELLTANEYDGVLAHGLGVSL
jgi:CMP-N-acetylneuraminic acid synthetase